jgi:hypothetical protein
VHVCGVISDAWVVFLPLNDQHVNLKASAMNEHQFLELSGRIFVLVAFISTPFLSVIAFRACLNSIRTSRPSRRDVFGTVATSLTLISWLAFVYFGLVVATDGRVGTFDSLLVLSPAAFLGSAAAMVLSVALKGGLRVRAFSAAALVTTLWGFSLLCCR